MRKGFVLVTALTMLVVLMALITAYFTLTRIEISSTKSVSDSTTGFYAAEAGLNLRVEQVKALFQNYGRPSTSGAPTNGLQDCLASASTSNVSDFSCQVTTIQSRKVYTFISPDSGGSTQGTIPAGSAFGGLSYTGYGYDLTSAAYNQNRPEAILKMRFTVQYIPMFQFAAFYDEDLELGPGPQMVIHGPMHSNGSVYLSASNGNPANVTLEVHGQVSAVGNLYRGRKTGDSEQGSTSCIGAVNVEVSGTSSLLALAPTGGSGASCPDQQVSNIASYQGSVRAGNGPEGFRVNKLQIPKPDFLDPVSGYTYWDKAELRLVLNLNLTPARLEVQDGSGGYLSAPSAAIQNCSGVVAANGATAASTVGGVVRYTNNFYNMREQKSIKMLDLDMNGLMKCIQMNSGVFGFNLNDTTDGGLVFYLSVKGPNSGIGCTRAPANNCPINDYGVRVRNAADLDNINGLTLITNQAVYIQGDYNSINKKPAAILSDSLNILSNAWTSDTDNVPCKGAARQASCNYGATASNTTINAALLSGVDLTANGNYNGGLQNYPRFHEYWTGVTLNYRGSFVSLDQARYVNGLFANQRYRPPNRAWDYDTDFNDPNKLPPLTPYVINVQQELFSRDFEQK